MSGEEKTEEDAIAETMVENLAQKYNMPIEEARAQYLPLLKTPSVRQRIKQQFADAADILGKAGEIAKIENPFIQSYIATITGEALRKVTSGKEEEEDLSEFARKLERDRQKFELIREIYHGESDKTKELKDVKTMIDTALSQIDSRLEALETKKRETEKQEVLTELDNKITPLKELAQSLMAWKEKLEAGESKESRDDIDAMISNIKKYEDDAKEFLTRRGYSVNMIRGMTEEEVRKLLEKERDKMLESLQPEQVKEILEKKGYKIEGGPMTYREHLEKLEEERKKIMEEKLADRQIEAVEKIVKDSIERLISEIFGPIIRATYEAAAAKGGPAPSQTESQGQSQSQEKQE
ncbi:MAG: hypothetical protein QMD10_11270 [Desulfitobacteriaceae bacterium]|nr:hypothetical protein [Desulfitobacteriaceae bacterium]